MRSTRLGWLLCLLLLISPSLVQAQASGCPEPRLAVGGQGRVSPGSPNRIRDTPSTSGTQVGQIPGEAVFDVLEGPTCAEGFLWWRVEFNDIEGWTVEGNADGYFVEPFDAEPVSCDVDDVPAPRLIIGQQGNVTSSTPSRIRVAPSVNAEQRGQIDPFDTFVVLDGPVCTDGYNWWQVRSGDVTGWVAEGTGDDYFLAPITPTPEVIPTFSFTPLRRPRTVSWSADGEWLAVLDDRGIWLYETSDLHAAHHRVDVEGVVNQIEFSPSTPEILAIAFDRGDDNPPPHVILYDVLAEETVIAMNHSSQSSMRADVLSFSGDGRYLAASDHDLRYVFVYDTTSGEDVWNPITEFDVRHTGLLSPDGDRMALLRNNRGDPEFVSVYETFTDMPSVELDRGGRNNVVTAIAYSPTGTHVVIGDDTGSLQLWNVDTGERISFIRRSLTDSLSNRVDAVTFSPDGEKVATAESDPQGIVRVYSTLGLAPLASYGLGSGNHAAVDLAFNPDGTRLAVAMWGTDYDAVHILDTETYEHIETLVVEEN